jgi:hypothetical protein
MGQRFCYYRHLAPLGLKQLYRKYKYYWPCHDLLPEFNHLVVVVLFGEATDSQGHVISNNFVVTAWAVFIYSKR